MYDAEWSARFNPPATPQEAEAEIAHIAMWYPQPGDADPLPIAYADLVARLESARARIWWRERYPQLQAHFSAIGCAEPVPAPQTMDAAAVVAAWEAFDAQEPIANGQECDLDDLPF